MKTSMLNSTMLALVLGSVLHNKLVLADGCTAPGFAASGKSSGSSPLLPETALPTVQVVASDFRASEYGSEAEQGGGPDPDPGEFVFWRNGDTTGELTAH